MTARLVDLNVGQKGRITGFCSGSPGLRRQLLTMGLTPGVEVEFIRVAPLGDPLELKVRGFRLSLRSSEARMVKVETQA